MSHTPTPWILQQEAGCYEEISLTRVARFFPDTNITQIVADCSHAMTRGWECEDNAAFIIRACNAHDELVSALTRIMHYANTGASVCDVDTSVQPEFVAVREILAKVNA